MLRIQPNQGKTLETLKIFSAEKTKPIHSHTKNINAYAHFSNNTTLEKLFLNIRNNAIGRFAGWYESPSLDVLHQDTKLNLKIQINQSVIIDAEYTVEYLN
jgi:hypothetical protein